MILSWDLGLTAPPPVLFVFLSCMLSRRKNLICVSTVFIWRLITPGLYPDTRSELRQSCSNALNHDDQFLEGSVESFVVFFEETVLGGDSFGLDVHLPDSDIH